MAESECNKNGWSLYGSPRYYEFKNTKKQMTNHQIRFLKKTVIALHKMVMRDMEKHEFTTISDDSLDLLSVYDSINQVIKKHEIINELKSIQNGATS